jgi:hypothetical protein
MSYTVQYEETNNRYYNTGDNNREQYDVSLSSITDGYVEIVADIRGDDPFGESLFLYAIQDSNNEYRGGIADPSYSDRVSKTVSGSEQQITTSPSSSHTTITIRLEFSPTEVAVYNDGNLRLSLSPNDTTVLQPTTFGYDIGQIDVYIERFTVASSGSAAPPTPNEPQNLSINSIIEDEIDLTWDSVGSEYQYNIYRSESSGSVKSDYTQINTISTSSFTDTNLEDGEEYYYRVTAEPSSSSNSSLSTSSFWDSWTPTPDFAIGYQDRFVGTVKNAPDPTWAQDGTYLEVKNASANATYTLDTVSPSIDLSGVNDLVCKIETENTSFRTNETGQPMRFKINGSTRFTYTGNPDGVTSFQTYTFDVSSEGSNSTISLEGQVISTSHAGQTILRIGDIELQ